MSKNKSTTKTGKKVYFNENGSKSYQPSKKKPKTFKEKSDLVVFNKDFNDFKQRLSDYLENGGDIDLVKKNLSSSLNRLQNLKKKLNDLQYTVISGKYYTPKVPKVPYSVQGRPSYYKASKYLNKDKSIPYDKTVTTVVRKMKLSIVDDVTKKTIYNGTSIPVTGDTYNRFFKNLLNSVFDGIDKPLRDLKDIFYSSSGSVLGSIVENPTSDRVNSTIARLLDFGFEEGWRDYKSSANLSSIFKTLIYGGYNFSLKDDNITYFNDPEIYNMLIASTSTDILKKEELLSLLINLSLSCSIYYYRKEKSEDILNLISSIRANIIRILKQYDTYSSNNDYTITYEECSCNLSDISYNGSDSMSDVVYNGTDGMPSNENITQTTVNANFNDVSGNVITTSVDLTSMSNYNNNSNNMISYEVSSNRITTPPTGFNSNIPINNAMNVIQNDSSNISLPSSLVTAFNPGNRPSKFRKLNSTQSIVYNQGYDTSISINNEQQFFNSPSISNVDIGTTTYSPTSVYNTLSANNMPNPKPNFTTNIQKVKSIMNYLYITLLHLIQSISGEKISSETIAAINEFKKNAGLSKYNLLNVNESSLPNILLELESNLLKVIDGDNVSSSSEASIPLNDTNIDYMIRGINSVIKNKKRSGSYIDTSVESNLIKQLRELKNTLSQRGSLNNLSMNVELQNVGEELDESENLNKVSSISDKKLMREMISILQSVLPIPDSSVIANKLKTIQ